MKQEICELKQMFANASETFYRALGHEKAYNNDLQRKHYAEELKKHGVEMISSNSSQESSMRGLIVTFNDGDEVEGVMNGKGAC